MRIAFILGEFPSLSQTFILNQITGMIDLGHEVKLFVNQPTDDKKVHPDVEKYNLMSHCFYFEIPKNKIKRFLKAIYLFFINFPKEPIKILKSLNIIKYSRNASCLRLFYATIFFINKHNKDCFEVNIKNNKINIFNHYKQLWFFSFNRTKGSNYQLMREYLAQVLITEIEEFKPLWDKKILDVGGARGEFCRILNKERNCDIINLEPYPEKPLIWKTKIGFADNIPFNDNEFDVVTCREVLEHIPKEKQQQSVNELYRVTKKGGVCYIAIPPWYNPYAGHNLKPFHIFPFKLAKWLRQLFFRNKINTNSFEEENLYPITFKKMLKMISLTDFKIITIKDTHFRLHFLTKIPLIREIIVPTIAFILIKDDKFNIPNFDIIHCHFGEVGNLGLHLKDIGVINGKIITSFHGHDANSVPNIYGKDIYADLFKKGELFTANTNFTKNQIINLGCDEKKIIIHPEGLNMEKFKFNKRIASDKIKLLAVARLGETKGHEYTIRAIAKVVKKHKNIEYIIAGEGPLKKELIELVNRLELNSYVKFLGEVEENEVLELYKQAHIFIQPSITTKTGDKEGQVLALQEAQATGLPIISTLHNGIPEGVIDGKSGFLVPERDSDALAERIEYFIENPELLSKMGKAGRKFVEKKYDIEILNKKLEQIYTKLIK